MRKLASLSCIAVLLTAVLYLVNAREGFYKDVFIDMGVSLGGPKTIPALAYLELTSQLLSTSDAGVQNKVMVESEDDFNGALLYPDGEPRFAVIYSHGGGMNHAGTLGDKGLKNIKDHYYHGGSHFGSCAGSFMLSATQNGAWYAIWDGILQMKDPYNVGGVKVDAKLPDDSPLLQYYDFGGDKLIESISHNNGGCVRTDEGAPTIPEGTEVLCLHENVPNRPKMDGMISCWAWKDNDTTGRVLGITSHPEGSSSGDKRDYMAACALHCIAGLAPPDVKAALVSEEKRIMDKNTEENDPAFTKIGDKQYHHYIIEVPDGGSDLSVELDAEDGYDMHLFVTKDTFAMSGIAEYADSSDGADKTISVETLEAGTWYVGVKCFTTVETKENNWGYEYTGKVEVLNGVEYYILASWDESSGIYAKNSFHDKAYKRLSVKVKGKCVSIGVGIPQPYNLTIYNLQGRVCWKPNMSKSTGIYTSQPMSAGMYIIGLARGKDIITKNFTIVR